MKNSINLLFLFVLFFIGFTACSDDDNNDPKITHIDGKPSRIKQEPLMPSTGYTKMFYYNGEKLSRIDSREESYAIIEKFEYKDNVLASTYSYIDNKDIADGTFSISFTKEDNKIIINHSAEPFYNQRFEMELDKNGIPVKITRIDQDEDENVEPENDRDFPPYSSLFEYNPVSKNLIKQTVILSKNSNKSMIIDYKYDDNVGVFSKVDLPLWYRAFLAYNNISSADVYSNLYIGITNNVIEKTVINRVDNTQSIVNYNYEYNKNMAPVGAGCDVLGLPGVSITY